MLIKYDNDKQFGAAINTIIKQKGISVSYIAQHVGVSRQQMYRLLNGDQSITLADLQKLLDAIDCTFNIDVQPLDNDTLMERLNRLQAYSESFNDSSNYDIIKDTNNGTDADT